MNGRHFFDEVGKAIPELKDRLCLDHIDYYADRKHAVAFFTSQVIVGEGQFALVRKILQRSFPQMNISLRVASPDLGQDFLDNPTNYAGIFETILLKHYPAMTSYIKGVQWSSEHGGIVLDMPESFPFEYMNRPEVKQKLSDAIYDIFLIKPNISIRLAQDIASRIEQQMAERKRESELLADLPAMVPAPAVAAAQAQKEKKISRKIVGGMISAEHVPIKELTELSGRVTIAGKVISVEKRNIQKSESILLVFNLTDYTDSIVCKLFLGGKRNGFRGSGLTESDPELEKRKIEGILSRIQPGAGLKVRGDCQMDTYDNALTIMVRDANQHDLHVRRDLAPEKRIELHAHTHMSYMDGLVSAADLIKAAAQFGHGAIAITDHSVVQSFPEAFSAARKNGIKLIPGMEGTMMDDTGIILAPGDKRLEDPVIVLDFETTGLNAHTDRIIEIGAVILQGGKVTDTFSTLVNPGVPLSDDIIRITGIKDYMLKDQPDAGEAIPKLLDFIGDRALAAHNASFDMSFLRAEMARIGRTFGYAQIDTLAFAQKLYPKMKRYRLADLCRHLGIVLKNAHRAVNDATATALCLAKMLDEAREKGARTLKDVNELIIGYNRNSRHHLTLLVASQQGMLNLNRLVSLSHIKHFYHEPLLPRDEIIRQREGLLIGSACWEGEVFQALLQNKGAKELERIARFYDYLEVQPEANHEPLIRSGKISSRERLREIIKAIVDLGERLNIPVVATGDVHFLSSSDAVFRSIIKNSLPQEKDGCDEQPPLYLKTTEEMLGDFDWLGTEKAKEIVILNPARIAGMIGSITLYPVHPEGKTTFAPVWEEAEQTVRDIAVGNAVKRYGDPLPAVIKDRLLKELNAIIGYGYATLYSIAQKLVKKSQNDGYMVGSRGSVGSSLVATMCGITEVNPLPPHYSCRDCRTTDFNVPSGCQVGVDLPDKECPVCGKTMQKDGYDIPFEVFLGFEGDKVPDIDLNFCSEYQSTAHAYVEDLFGEGYVFRAGTIGTLQEKTAFGYVLKYLEERGMTVSQAEKARLAQGCIGVKRTTGQHPGGMVILPKAYEINQFTAIQRPANDQASNAVTTHYDFASMHDILVKVDVLGHDDPTMIRMMEDLSGVKYQDIPLGDPKVLSLFRTPEALGLSKEQLKCSTGTLGIPEFGTPFVRGILEETQPKTMADLIRISGLSHGTEVWAGNSRDLILQGTATLAECICTREDIMTTLMDRNLSSKMAFDIMESVRKGKGLTAIMEKEMLEHEVPDWFIKSCWKIAYMFPKGHAVAYVTMAMRVGWFKVNMPLVYYSAYFSIRGKEFNSLSMTKPVSYIDGELEVLSRLSKKEITDKNEKEIIVLELVREMLLRGFTFLPVDLYKSDPTLFLIEGNALRCPFSSLPGFGENAARGLAAARAEGFSSVEELKSKAKISSSAIEQLREGGVLNGLSKTNQVSFFSL